MSDVALSIRQAGTIEAIRGRGELTRTMVVERIRAGSPVTQEELIILHLETIAPTSYDSLSLMRRSQRDSAEFRAYRLRNMT